MRISPSINTGISVCIFRCKLCFGTPPNLNPIREQRRNERISALREGARTVAAKHPQTQVWLFGSLALTQQRWDELASSDEPYWREIRREAIRRDAP